MRYSIKRGGRDRTSLGNVTLEAIEDGKTREIAPMRSQSVRNHSPDGFEFGYDGSGPAQLALAIMLDFIGNPNVALGVYQDFKREFTSRLAHPGGEIEESAILEWLKGRVPEV